MAWLATVAAANIRPGQRQERAVRVAFGSLRLKAYRDVAQKSRRDAAGPGRKVGQLLGHTERRRGEREREKDVQRKTEG